MKVTSLLLAILFSSLVLSSEYTQGLLAIDRHDWENAAKHLEQSFEKTEQNKAEIALLLAQLDQKFLMQDRLYYALVADKDKSLTNTPLQRIIADLSFKEANFDRAQEYYQKILDKNDSLSEYARYQLAWVKVNQGQVGTAVKLLADYDFHSPESTLQSPIARDLGRFTVEAIEAKSKTVHLQFNLGDKENQRHFYDGIISGLNRSKAQDKHNIIQELQATNYFPGLIATFIQKQVFNQYCEWVDYLNEESYQEAVSWFSANDSLLYLQQCKNHLAFSVKVMDELAKQDKHLRSTSIHALALGQDENGCRWLIDSFQQQADPQGLLLAAQKCSLSYKEIKNHLLPQLPLMTASDFRFLLEKYPKEIMGYALKNQDELILERTISIDNIGFLAKAEAKLLEKLLRTSKSPHLKWIIAFQETGQKIPKDIRSDLSRENFSKTFNGKSFDIWLKYFLDNKSFSSIKWEDIIFPENHPVLKNKQLMAKSAIEESEHKVLFDQIKELKSLLSKTNKEDWFHRSLFDQTKLNLQKRQSSILAQIQKDIETTADVEKKSQLSLIYQAVKKIIEGSAT